MSLNLTHAAKAAGLQPYEWSGYYTSGGLGAVAERLTEGKTHYYTASTRRYHGASVSKLRVIADGMALACIERVALDYEKTRKGYRVVVHDLCGTVINNRASLDEAHKTLPAATREFERICAEYADGGAAILKAAIQGEVSSHERALASLQSVLAEL